MARNKSVSSQRHRLNEPVLLLFRSEPHQLMLPEVIAEADRRGWQLLNLEFSDTRVPPYIEPRGAIVDVLYDSWIADGIRERGCPIVRVGRLPHPRDGQMPAVLPDLEAAGRLAARHFAERGFRNLGYVGYKGHLGASIIWDGYQNQARELGCTCNLLKLQTEGSDAETRAANRNAREREWLMAMPRPFAVFTHSDVRAGQLLCLCLSAGLSVPEEVAILSYGNRLRACESTPIKLSAVDINPHQKALAAVELLEQLMEGHTPDSAPVMVPPSGVVQRQSTDVLAVPHAGVARALRFIWDHLDRPLSVDDIAREAGMSRTGLNGAFRRHLGRSVNAELSRKRLERCTELLRSSDLSISQIALATGFATRTYLHRTFQKEHGMTPRQYRLQHQPDVRDPESD